MRESFSAQGGLFLLASMFTGVESGATLSAEYRAVFDLNPADCLTASVLCGSLLHVQ
jgi:hypothetical protein